MMAKYECTVCGYIYDEEKEGVPWDQLPEDWLCPDCDSDKSYFECAEAQAAPAIEPAPVKTVEPAPKPAAETDKKRLVICNVCGYIMEDGEHHDQCPACGVSKKAFSPYKDKVKPKRRKLLNLHMHNIIVHFPQAFAVFMLFLLVAVFLIEDPLKAEFAATAKILAIFLPLSVLAGLFTGLIDGKTRYKRLNTIIFKRKIAVGIVFFLCSVGIVILLTVSSLTSGSGNHIFALILAAICSAASVFLGHNGGRLSGTEVPG